MKSTRKRMKYLTLILSLLTATWITAVDSGPAHAVVSNKTGIAGFAQIPGQASCSYMRTNTAGWLALGVNPPIAWAAPGRTQSIRYQLIALSAYNGQILATSNWSGWQTVRGNTPARWSGAGYVNVHWRSNAKIAFNIEFYRPSGGFQGRVTATPNSYLYYDQRIGPFGPIATCYKWR